MELHIFDPITTDIPHKKILSRLGYALGKTVVSQEQKDQFDTYIDEAAGNIVLKGAARRVPLEYIDAEGIVLEGNIIFKSRSLRDRFSSCQELLLTAATAGENIINCIRKVTSSGDMARAVVYDAAASEMVDAALDWIMEYFSSSLRRENKQAHMGRFSCGYGDFSLDNQKVIWETLHLKKLGIRLTERFMMEPEKSVTAVAGIGRIKNDA